MKKTIVAFHVGRGGRFNNQGHVTFIGEQPIGDFTYDLFRGFENQYGVLGIIGDRTNLLSLYESAVADGTTDSKAYNRLQKFGLDLGEICYYDGSGHNVGLTAEQVEWGIGTINIDNQYDTTYTCYLEDCEEVELQLIIDTNRYVSAEVLNYAQSKLESIFNH